MKKEKSLTKSRLRIIALRPITPVNCDENVMAMVRSIQKKVFGSDWMYFYSGYKLTDIPDMVCGDDGDMLPAYGYYLEVPKDADKDGLLFDTDNLCVSISAVVGPNGSGKSSAIELMIRILNNLSVAAKGETKNHIASEHLYFIENVYGAIVAAEGDHYFLIQVYGRSVKVASYVWKEENHHYERDYMPELLTLTDKNDRYEPILGNGIGQVQLYNLFYTAIFNYSMYAYNYMDYYEERTIENRWATENERDKEGKATFGEPYTQDQCWLKGLFHKNDGYQTPIVLNPMRDEGIINVPKENSLATERVRNMLFYENEHEEGHGGQPLFPFRIVNSHLEVVALKISAFKEPKFGRDSIIGTLKLENTPLARNFEKSRKRICDEWAGLMFMRHDEATDEQKIAWDYVAYKTLKIITTYDKYEDARKDIVESVEIDEAKIERCLKEMQKDDSHITLKLRQALNFLKFRVFRGHMNCEGGYVSLYEAYKRFEKQITIFNEMNMRMQNGRMLVNLPKGYTDKDIPHFSVDFKTMHLQISYKPGKEKPVPVIYMKDGRLIMRYPGHQEILPPPIYDMQLMLIEKDKIKENGRFDNKDIFPMSGLSSGEKQIAGAVSNFAYHLANIDSVWEDKSLKVLGRIEPESGVKQDVPLIRYKYVNVVFDEVELYFHPDLQRRFVSLLMDAIKNLHLEHVEGVNMLLVTHSPFVLSDLPRSNVLAIGEDEDEVKETFCANIHEMLGNSFFMKYTMGDLAREQVEEIFKLYNEFEESEDKKGLIASRALKWPQYEYVASLVADEYLHGLVGRMLEEMSKYLPEPDEDIDEQIKEAEEWLKTLKERKEKQHD